MRKTVIVILISLAMAAVAIAATIDSIPLIPGGVRGSDKVPLGRVGVATSYTASMDQIKVYVFGNNTSNPGVYAFNGRQGAVTPQAGDYTAAQVGADPSGTASAAVTNHNSVYNHLNIPTNQQIGAMTGTSGTPSTTNAFVTNSDPRNSNARTPTAHAATHAANGTDPLTLVTSQVQGLDTALAGKQAALSNAATLGKITESGNLPLWNNAPWPGGGGGGGDMYKATYDPQGKNGDAFSRANHTGTQAVTTITGLAPSATTDTTTTANIASSTDKRFVTDAQQSVLINTSGVNSGNVTIGTANGLSLAGQQLSLQLATNAQAGALSAADHTSYAQAASLAATALQAYSTLDATKLSGAVTVANGGTGATTAAAARTALAVAPIDNPTFTTGATAPVFTSNVTDGQHMVFCANSGDMTTTGWTTADAGRFCYNQATGKYRYWTGSALADWTGSGGGTGTVTSITASAPLTGGTITATGTIGIQQATTSTSGYLTSTDWNTFNGKAPLASPVFTGTPTAPTAPAGTNNTQLANTAFVANAVASAGGGTGTIGGSTGSTDNAILVASGTLGSTVKATPVTISTDGVTLTTAQSASAADSIGFRAQSSYGTNKVNISVVNGTITPWTLLLSDTQPADGCVNIAAGVLGSTGSPCGNGSGSGITALTGDVTASGTGSVAATVISASTSQAGKVQLTDSVSSTSTTTAATPNSVKQAYDLAASKGTGIVTGVSVATANGVSGTSSGGATPALTFTLGAITPTSVAANGTVDGNAVIAVANGGTITARSSINVTTGATTWTLPATELGKQACFRQTNNATNLISVTPPTGSYVEAQARTSYCTVGHAIKSGGAATDAVCLIGVDATHWVMMGDVGTWTCQ